MRRFDLDASCGSVYAVCYNLGLTCVNVKQKTENYGSHRGHYCKKGEGRRKEGEKEVRGDMEINKIV